MQKHITGGDKRETDADIEMVKHHCGVQQLDYVRRDNMINKITRFDNFRDKIDSLEQSKRGELDGQEAKTLQGEEAPHVYTDG